MICSLSTLCPPIKRNPVFVQSLQATAHDLTEYSRVDAFLRKTGDSHRRERRACHSPNIVNRIERGYLSVDIRIVDDRCKEIERLHNCEVVAKAVYTRVVGCIEADNQIFVKRLFW